MFLWQEREFVSITGFSTFTFTWTIFPAKNFAQNYYRIVHFVNTNQGKTMENSHAVLCSPNGILYFCFKFLSVLFFRHTIPYRELCCNSSFNWKRLHSKNKYKVQVKCHVVVVEEKLQSNWERLPCLSLFCTHTHTHTGPNAPKPFFRTPHFIFLSQSVCDVVFEIAISFRTKRVYLSETLEYRSKKIVAF